MLTSTVVVTVSDGLVSTTVTRTDKVGPTYDLAEIQIECIGGKLAEYALDELRAAMKDRTKIQ